MSESKSILGISFSKLRSTSTQASLFHPLVKLSSKEPSLPHPPKPPDPLEPPDQTLSLSHSPMLYLTLVYLASYCVKTSSPLSLGLVSPDRKLAPASIEACLLPFSAMSASDLPLPQVDSTSPSDYPTLDFHRIREKYVSLVLRIVGLDRLSQMVVMACVPSCGPFTALVRICTVFCRIFAGLFVFLVVLELTPLWWQLGQGSPIIDTLPVNLVSMDSHSHLFSFMEHFLLPFTTLAFSGSVRGSILFKFVLLEAEARMSLISRLAVNGANILTSTSLEDLSPPYWKLKQDYHGEVGFFIGCFCEFATLVEPLSSPLSLMLCLSSFVAFSILLCPIFMLVVVCCIWLLMPYCVLFCGD